jgi:peptide/nickel transport system permease protein
MATLIIRRLAAQIPVLLGVSTIVFLILHLTPGDPAQMILGDFATREAVEQLREEMGLNKPLHIQYGLFLGNLARGELGRSITQRQPVTTLITHRLQATAELALFAMLIAVILGLTLGVLAAVNQNSFTDYAITTGSLLGVSTPIFYLGLLLILLFSLNLGWFPVSGRGPALIPAFTQLFQGDAKPLLASLRHLFLPALTLGLSFAALLAKMTRGAMLEVLQKDFIRTARAKGVLQVGVVFKHALRNAGIPLLTILGLQFSSLLGGSVLTETVFAWPGLGRLAVDAIFSRDFPLVQGAVLAVAVIFVLLNLFVDVLYGLVDPRVTYS